MIPPSSPERTAPRNLSAVFALAGSLFGSIAEARGVPAAAAGGGGFLARRSGLQRRVFAASQHTLATSQ